MNGLTRCMLRRLTATLLFFLAGGIVVAAANPPGWAGTYFDKKRLKGQGYFQMGINESGGAIQIVFNAGYNNGGGVAPEGQGSAKPNANDTLEFKFHDSCKNSGSGTIKRAGNDIVVDFIFANGADMKCLAFYERNMHLKRVK